MIAPIINTEYSSLPLFSIITPAYNSGDTIQNCIESVSNQSLGRHLYEHIIIYRESRDDTRSIVETYESLYDLKVFLGQENGWVNACNEGIIRASGEYVILLMSDDALSFNVLERVADIISSARVDIISGDVLWRRNDLFVLLKSSSPSEILKGMHINHPGLFVRRKLYLDIGLYDTSLPFSADWEFLVRAYKHSIKWTSSNLVHVTFSYGGQSISSMKQFLNDNEKIRLRHGLKKTILFKAILQKVFLSLFPSQFPALIFYVYALKASFGAHNE